MKVLGWCFAVGFILIIAFLFTSYQVGPVKKMRGVVLLEHIGVIKDTRSNAELIMSLKNSNEVEQFNAITAMAYRRYSPENAEALLDYLKSDKGTKRVKNIAVWALGELHTKEAKDRILAAISQYILYYNQDFKRTMRTFSKFLARSLSLCCIPLEFVFQWRLCSHQSFTPICHAASLFCNFSSASLTTFLTSFSSRFFPRSFSSGSTAL